MPLEKFEGDNSAKNSFMNLGINFGFCGGSRICLFKIL